MKKSPGRLHDAPAAGNAFKSADNSKIASRYACRSKSRSRAWASASAHLGNQTPSVDEEKGFIEQLCKAELTLGLEICYHKLNMPGTKAENRD